MTVRESVIREREANPCDTLRQIATKVGVSFQRVSIILASANLPTTHWKPTYICNNCGRTFLAIHVRSRLLCSPDCRKKYYQTKATVQSDVCVRLFTIRYTSLSNRVNNGYKYLFCSQSFKGTLGARHYGFHARPPNGSVTPNMDENKWDYYIPRIREMLQQGKSLRQIIKEIGIPESTLYILRKKEKINRY